MKIQVTINDTLNERAEGAADDTRLALLRYIEEHELTEGDDCPDLSDLNFNGEIDEIADRATPINTSEINDTMYLHGGEIEEAFESRFGAEAKTQEGGPLGWQAVAICTYINDQIAEWYSDNAEGIFDEAVEAD
jgi:hypothetical protein